MSSKNGSSKRRVLTFESCENRRLLAADAGSVDSMMWPDDVADLQFAVRQMEIVSPPGDGQQAVPAIEGCDVGTGADDPDLDRNSISRKGPRDSAGTTSDDDGGTTGDDGGTTGGDGGTTGGDWSSADTYHDDDIPMG